MAGNFEEYRRQQSVFVLEAARSIMLPLPPTTRALCHRPAWLTASRPISRRFLDRCADRLWAYCYRLYAHLPRRDFELHIAPHLCHPLLSRDRLHAPLREMTAQLWGQQLPELASLADLTERICLLNPLLWRHQLRPHDPVPPQQGRLCARPRWHQSPHALFSRLSATKKHT
ncbi:MAG: hypothetical protein R2932_42200 [Caldilineaceae bacterium]